MGCFGNFWINRLLTIELSGRAVRHVRSNQPCLFYSTQIMFLDFELFYSRPRFNNADSNSPTPELITSIDHDTSPGAVQPVLPSSTMTTGHLTPWAVAAGDTIARHLFPRRARTYFIITRHVFLVEHELISWCHHSTRFPRRARTDFQISSDITRHVFLVEHELISWCHHSTRFPRRARTDFLIISSDITRHVFLVKHELRNKVNEPF